MDILAELCMVSVSKIRKQMHFQEVSGPLVGNEIIGGSGRLMEKTDAEIIVSANGGLDLIYVPRGSSKRVWQIVVFLCTQDYI
jgi:hypothetical protein